MSIGSTDGDGEKAVAATVEVRWQTRRRRRRVEDGMLPGEGLRALANGREKMKGLCDNHEADEKTG